MLLTTGAEYTAEACILGPRIEILWLKLPNRVGCSEQLTCVADAQELQAKLLAVERRAKALEERDVR